MNQPLTRFHQNSVLNDLTSPVLSPAMAHVLTPSGRGAVAVVEALGLSDSHLEGLNHFFSAANGRPLIRQELQQVVYGRWGTSSPEDIVVCRTATDRLELQCHGGEAAVRRICDDLQTAGIKVAENREADGAAIESSARDATVFASGLIEQECQTVLIQALTWRTADLANEQARGVLSTAFGRLRWAEDSPVSMPQLLTDVRSLLRWAPLGLRLSQPWKVVLTGRPNVGKSSLINQMAGFDRAIVSPLAGTTRDAVTVLTALQGWPIQFIDTAGLRETQEPVEAAGIDRARQVIQQADLALLLLDQGEAPIDEDLALLSEADHFLIVAHKCDRPNHWGDELPIQALPVSSQTGQGVRELQDRIVRHLVPDVPAPGTPLPLSARQRNCLLAMERALLQNDTLQYRQQFDELMGP